MTRPTCDFELAALMLERLPQDVISEGGAAVAAYLVGTLAEAAKHPDFPAYLEGRKKGQSDDDR